MCMKEKHDTDWKHLFSTLSEGFNTRISPENYFNKSSSTKGEEPN